jgi:hypothetical protein
MTATVVPTRATCALAARMIETARKEDHSGADAAILFLDELHPDQSAALVALLCDAAAGRAFNVPGRVVAPGECADCRKDVREKQTWRGLCRNCYDRHRYAQTLGQFATKEGVAA